MKNYKSKLRQTPKRSSLMNSAIWIAVWSILLSGVVASINIKFDPVQENEVVAIQTPTPKPVVPEGEPEQQQRKLLSFEEFAYLFKQANDAWINHFCGNLKTEEAIHNETNMWIQRKSEPEFYESEWNQILNSVLQKNQVGLTILGIGIERNDPGIKKFCESKKHHEV